MQPPLDDIDGCAGHLGDLGVGHLGAEFDQLTVPRVEPGDQRLDVFLVQDPRDALEWVRAVPAGRDIRGGIGVEAQVLPAHQFGAELERDVDRDSVEPRRELGPAVESREPAERLEVDLLDDVIGVGGVALEHPPDQVLDPRDGRAVQFGHGAWVPLLGPRDGFGGGHARSRGISSRNRWIPLISICRTHSLQCPMT